MGIGKKIGSTAKWTAKIATGTIIVDIMDTVTGAREKERAEEAAAAKRREERKLQQALKEEELRKDRQLRDLKIEQLLDEKAEREKIAAKKKITRKSP
jgi:hypothetical protein